MQERAEDFFDDWYESPEVKRYEASLRGGKMPYFDIEELENIIDYYMVSDKAEKAQRVCLEGLKIHPESQELVFKNILIFIMRRKAEEALFWLQKAYKLTGGVSVEYHNYKGQALLLQKQYSSAFEHFDIVMTMVDNMFDAIAMVTDIGEALEDAGYYSKAIFYYKEILSRYPEQFEISSRIAFCYDKLGEFKSAVYYYEAYLDEDPFDYDIWFDLGIDYNRLGEYDKSVEAYDYCLALNENHNNALFNKANTLANAGLFDKAVKVYEDYIDKAEDTLLAKYYIGECYVNLKMYDKALEYFKDILTEDSEFSEAYYGLGLVFEATERFSEAEEHYMLAIKYDENNLDAWFSVGNLLLQMERYTDAIDSFVNVLKDNKADVDAWLLLAKCYYKAGKPHRTLKLLTDALTHLPDNVRIIYTLAAYNIKEGYNDMGIEWFKHAYVKDKDSSKLFFEVLGNSNINEITDKQINSIINGNIDFL